MRLSVSKMIIFRRQAHPAWYESTRQSAPPSSETYWTRQPSRRGAERGTEGQPHGPSVITAPMPNADDSMVPCRTFPASIIQNIDRMKSTVRVGQDTRGSSRKPGLSTAMTVRVPRVTSQRQS